MRNIQRTEMWSHSQKINKLLEEYGARTSGTIQQREDRLKRFQEAAEKVSRSQGYLDAVRKVQNEARELRIQKRCIDLMSQPDDNYSQSFWCPPRDPETGEAPLKKQRIDMELCLANVVDTMEKYKNHPTQVNIREAKKAWNDLRDTLDGAFDLLEVSVPTL